MWMLVVILLHRHRKGAEGAGAPPNSYQTFTATTMTLPILICGYAHICEFQYYNHILSLSPPPIVIVLIHLCTI